MRERQAHIVRSATGLLLRQGFHKTSVREIAAAANVTMGTLYLYIARKEDVLYLIADAIMSVLADGLRSVQPGDTPTETLWSAADYYFRAVDRMRSEVSLLYRESASLMPEHLQTLKQSELEEREFFASIIREGIEKGEFRPVHPDLTAHNVIMLAHMWALKGWTLRDSFDLDGYIEQQLAFLLGDLLVPQPP